LISKVVVLGLGFVGSAMSVAIASSKNTKSVPNFDVVGIDLPNSQGRKRIKAINEGKFPFSTQDQKLVNYLNTCHDQGNLRASSSKSHLKDADYIVIDINLDARKKKLKNQKVFSSFEVEMKQFKNSIKEIASVCKPSALILIETTVPPGTTENIVLPIFKRIFKKRKILSTPCIAHSYERVMPGPNYLDSIINFPRVYSGIDTKSEDKCLSFLSKIISNPKKNLLKLHSTNASEMSKVLENSYRAMNIAFIDEWSKFADISNVNLYEILDAIKTRPTHNNIMSPGLGVGGYCLTKDPLLASWSSKNIFNSSPLPTSESAVKINDMMPSYTHNLIQQNLPNSSNILICGLSYISGVGDDRYTPVGLLYDLLIKDNHYVEIVDPYLTSWSIKNKKIRKYPKLKSYDAVIISTSHAEYQTKEFVKTLKGLSPQLLVDCWNIYKNQDMENYFKILTPGNGLRS